MSAPDITEADASELVLGLTSPAPSEAFSLFKVQADGSKKEFKLRVRLLREEETISAIEEAQKYARSKGEAPPFGDVYKEAQACSLISRVLLRAEKRSFPNGTEYYPQLFIDTAQLRAAFTANEIAVCLNAHEVVKAKYRCLDEWKPEELDLWAARLSDTLLGPFFLGRLDSAHWPDLMFALGRRNLELSEALGLTSSTTPDSSESSPDTSADGTGGSQQSPHVSLPSGEQLPEDKLLTRDEAAEIAKRMRDQKP